MNRSRSRWGAVVVGILLLLSASAILLFLKAEDDNDALSGPEPRPVAHEDTGKSPIAVPTADAAREVARIPAADAVSGTKPVEVPARKEILIAGEKFVEERTSSRRRILYVTGETYFDVPLVDGKEQGSARCWYKNGQVHSMEEYVSGRREGQCSYYSDKGAKIAEGAFVHGYEDGIWHRWYDNGQLESEGRMRAYEVSEILWAQEKTGWWTFWDLDGRVDRNKTGDYVHGERVGS